MQLDPELRSEPGRNENVGEIATRIANSIYHGIWIALDQLDTLTSIYSTTVPSQFAVGRISQFPQIPEFPQVPEFPGVMRRASLTEMDSGCVGAEEG